MKPFDFNEALSGADVQTKSGKKVKELYLFKDIKDFPLKVHINGENNLRSYTKDGIFYHHIESEEDLIMSQKCTPYYLNIYQGLTQKECGGLYETMEEAENNIIEKFIKTIKIIIED